MKRRAVNFPLFFLSLFMGVVALGGNAGRATPVANQPAIQSKPNPGGSSVGPVTAPQGGDSSPDSGSSAGATSSGSGGSGPINSMPLGSVVKGFVMPQRNAMGDLQAMIRGDQATVVSLNRTQIEGLRVDLYENQKNGPPHISTVITSPQCDYWNLERRLSGQSGVLITRPELRVSSDAVDWDFKTETAIFRQHVKVVLTQFEVGASAAGPSPSSVVKPSLKSSSAP